MLSEKQYLNLDKIPEMIDNDANYNGNHGRGNNDNLDPGNLDPGNLDHGNLDPGNLDPGNLDHGNNSNLDHGNNDHIDHGNNSNHGRGNNDNLDYGRTYRNDKLKTNLLGQGSYGCVYYPGINCNGKMNNKPYVTKLQEITFYSINEINIGKYIKTHIKQYRSLFAPIIKYCIVSFQTILKSELNIDGCDIIYPNNKKYYYQNYEPQYDDNHELKYGDNYERKYGEKYRPKYDNFKSLSGNYKNKLHEKINTKYYLMYMNYIHNQTIKSYFQNFNNFDIYSVKLIRSYFIIIKSIGILINNKIIHNDLHVNNILINLKNNKPVIIDFGLGIFFDKCFEYKNKSLNFEYLKNTLFDFRDDQYHVILEKRFVSFIIYNKTHYYSANISENYKKNELTTSIIDVFIKDSYETIANQKIIPFTNVELAEYYKSLKQFYYQFLNKYKYPNYNVIVVYLLNLILMYTDLYSVIFDIFYIHFSVKFETMNSNSGSKLFFDFILQVLKKNLHPNPLMRLQYSQITSIFTYIIRSIKKSHNSSSYEIFITEFRTYIISQSINPKILFHKTFAEIDFTTILNKDVYYFVKHNF